MGRSINGVTGRISLFVDNSQKIVDYKYMKLFQILLTVFLLGTLFLDWGGFGRSLFNRILNFDDIYVVGEGLWVVFMSFALLLLLFKKGKRREDLFSASITTFVFVFITGFLAWMGYAFSNFLSYGESRDFDGATPATIVLGLLFITFIFQLIFFKKSSK